MSSTERPEDTSSVLSPSGSSLPVDRTPDTVDSPTAPAMAPIQPADAEAWEGVAAPAASAPAPQARAKTKGVADIVFVVDISGSMAPCIDALRKNIESFIDSLSQGDGNHVAAV